MGDSRGRHFRSLFGESIGGRLKVCSIRLELPPLGVEGRLTRLQSGRLGRVLVRLLLQGRALFLDATLCVHSFRAFNRRLLSLAVELGLHPFDFRALAFERDSFRRDGLATLLAGPRVNLSFLVECGPLGL